jgi:ubiquinone/menaquinone biosynthesis C-methylase UbiE
VPPQQQAESTPLAAAGHSRFSRRATLLARHEAAEELLDRAEHDPIELAANLRDIRTVNRLAGGTTTVLRHLPGLVCRVPRGHPVTLLDLATGSGDIPLAIHAWAARNGRPVQMTLSDRSPQVLDEARHALNGFPAVSFVICDARAVPMPDRAFDVVLCSLALHHFDPPDAMRVLHEMHRLSRTGFIVNDIRRCVTGYAAAWLTSRLATRNQLTRHDMPLSVQRAYTPDELRGLLLEAGIPGAVVTTHPLFRMSAVYRQTDA